MKSKMTIRDIAGFCPEEAIWKMMADVSGFLLNDGIEYVLTPDSIVIDGNMFMIEKDHEMLNEFIAPEQHEGQPSDVAPMVWSLGAVAYYSVTGHVIFGGHGSDYQREHPSVVLPVLPKGFQMLTAVLHKCICHNPEERISLKELYELSQKGLEECVKQQSKRRAVVVKEMDNDVKHNVEKWPEEMIEV